ncbi:adenylyltransferase/cytidyltransferase family protein [Mesorhizobium sp. M1374]|uniref:adenylyltransferase/cytidyltransferase family protein n=1 Tax=Mesorhizobium sp. M1374 TaxID=2957091 RepID=UPI00333DC258
MWRIQLNGDRQAAWNGPGCKEREWQEGEVRTVFVSGVFDLFHRGHVELLNRAAKFGDRLVVGVNSDEMVERYKRRPVFGEADRLAIVRSMRWVTDAVIYGEFDLKPMVERFRPSVMVHGDDWPRESYLNQIRMTEQDLELYGVELVFVPYWRGTSTTSIVEQLNGSRSVNRALPELPLNGASAADFAI